ncbi:hypothetical protein LX36DRAFT_17253 [Colletotrichum falcatum]|nr:hypothetical protein LX36DRAFT_17253 [Colletotrichum falcatum]
MPCIRRPPTDAPVTQLDSANDVRQGRTCSLETGRPWASERKAVGHARTVACKFAIAGCTMGGGWSQRASALRLRCFEDAEARISFSTCIVERERGIEISDAGPCGTAAGTQPIQVHRTCTLRGPSEMTFRGADGVAGSPNPLSPSKTPHPIHSRGADVHLAPPASRVRPVSLITSTTRPP